MIYALLGVDGEREKTFSGIALDALQIPMATVTQKKENRRAAELEACSFIQSIEALEERRIMSTIQPFDMHQQNAQGVSFTLHAGQNRWHRRDRRL